MANDYQLIENTLINTTGEGALLPSLSRCFGPWDSTAAFESYLSSSFRISTSSIPVGLEIGVKIASNAGGTQFAVQRYEWAKPAGINGSGYWKLKDIIPHVIEFAGIVIDPVVISSSTMAQCTKDMVFYNEEDGTFVATTNGGNSYFSLWNNYFDYGMVDDGSVYPHEGKLYIDSSTGQMFYATSGELSPYGGGSGISSELLEELERLKTLNIRFSGNSLIIYDETEGKDKSYNLARGGEESDEDVYDTPTISLSYTTPISYQDSSTNNPTILVEQDYTPAGGTAGTLTYRSVNALRSAGAVVSFEMGDGSDPAFSVNNNGVLSVGANTENTERTATVKVSVTLNGQTASYTTSTITQGAAKLYITAIEYPHRYLDNYSSGVVSVGSSDISVTLSNGTTTNLGAYIALSTDVRETFTLSCENTQGASFNGETGAISYTPPTLLTNFFTNNPTGVINTLFIALVQEGRQDIDCFYDLFEYQTLSSTDSMTVLNNTGGKTSQGKENQLQYYVGRYTLTGDGTTAGIAVNAGDYVLVTIPQVGNWYWLWESGVGDIHALTGSAIISVARGLASSDWMRTVITKVQNSGELSIGYYSTYKPLTYKKISFV